MQIIKNGISNLRFLHSVLGDKNSASASHIQITYSKWWQVRTPARRGIKCFQFMIKDETIVEGLSCMLYLSALIVLGYLEKIKKLAMGYISI